MRVLLSVSMVVAAAGIAGCRDAAGPPGPADAPDAMVAAAGNGVQLHVNGDGSYNAGVIVDFEMSNQLHGDGRVTGSFRHSTVLGGQVIEFVGRTTCLATDPVNNRAWIAGVITENNSTHPSFTTAIHQVGRDIWFRVVDYGNGGSGVRDRTTFVGFEGGAGIITSAQYCATMPWPANDERTSPLVSGNLKVK